MIQFIIFLHCMPSRIARLLPTAHEPSAGGWLLKKEGTEWPPARRTVVRRLALGDMVANPVVGLEHLERVTPAVAVAILLRVRKQPLPRRALPLGELIEFGR